MSKELGVLKQLEATLNTRHVTAHELGHLMNGLFMMPLFLSIWPAPMPYWSLLFSRKSDGATLIQDPKIGVVTGTISVYVSSEP